MTTPNRFDYVAYDMEAHQKSLDFKQRFMDLAAMVEQTLDAAVAGRYRALALTSLEEAFMWCGKAIRDEQVAKRKAELQEARGNE